MLRGIIDDRLGHHKRGTKFFKQTGWKIEHLQKISDVRKQLGMSWQKAIVTGQRTSWLIVQKQAEAFVRRERRFARSWKWFVDQIKLPDAPSDTMSYGKCGEPPVVVGDASSSPGTGTGIMSWCWHGAMFLCSQRREKWWYEASRHGKILPQKASSSHERGWCTVPGPS